MPDKGSIEQTHIQKYAQAIHTAQLSGPESFQSWFNRVENLQQAVVRGYWDMALHILTPKVTAYLSQPENKVALEIGYGGGRLLNAACSYFMQAVGVDIHEEGEEVARFLRSQGKENFRLIKSNGRSLEVEAEGIDIIYSFIVLQHLPSLEVFVSYLQESYRALKPGGIAQLYFGKYTKISRRDQARCFLRGYCELPDAPVNFTSLVIRRWKARQLCREAGFTVLVSGSSYKNAPDGYPGQPGGQVFVTLLKPKKN